MLGDERILPKSELAFQARQCASCGADIEVTDVYCAECGAELPPMAVEPSASLPSAPATTEPPSEYVFAGLAALAPRDALRVLLASYPAMLRDRAMFLAAMERLFTSDGQRRTRFCAVQGTEIMASLQGKSSVSAAEWERIVSDLEDVCGFSQAVAVESAEEWCYALNVKHPPSRRAVTSGPSPASECGAKDAGRWPIVGAVIAVLLVCTVFWVVFGGSTTYVVGDRQTLVLPGDVAMEFMWCPPGTFTMGSPGSELGHQSDEGQHEVTLSQGFWMARYPTTQLQYSALIGGNPSKYKGDAHPVEMVSWHDAVAFCEKVNDHLGAALPEGFRCALPTEAQWEYACRAGTTSALNSGRELTSERGTCPNLDVVAWYDANSEWETHSVGQKQPNAWGLYDMHGNVCEWCRDWYGAYPVGSVTNPTGPENGSRRVGRGGGYDYESSVVRSAQRSVIESSERHNDRGFRPVLFRLADDQA